jgi:hypothetical protein
MNEDHEALYTLEYQQPVTGKLFFLEEVSFDKDKTRWYFGRGPTPPYFVSYDACVELLLLAKDAVPGVEISRWVGGGFTVPAVPG